MEVDAITRREYESDKKSLWNEVRRIAGIVEGPPHPGLEKRVDNFLTKFETLEIERAKQHKENRARLNFIIGLLTLIALYVPIYLDLHH